MFTKFKMCTYVINNTSNAYYSAVMAMRTILCLRKGIDEPMEAYYRRFEASISMAELEKLNATTHV